MQFSRPFDTPHTTNSIQTYHTYSTYPTLNLPMRIICT